MITVLLVEDETDFAEVLRDVLELRGFRVVLAHNGRAGLDRAAEESPDVIVTDLMMPILDGYELLEQLHASDRLRNIPVIMMSSTERIGHHPFLRKPFRVDALVDLIHEMVNRPASADENPGDD